ncbi:uncharacterized protein LOC123697445 [Colias croceus]|uniref:uncharacterized protein LOC123697445 n=1 Tax=Colias crocea TaxID=72248 RepID=UPI001E279FBA|nr:uncharacterized protein LOC123697445 [Colias croceus]
MLLFKVATAALLVLVVTAEKKIELQDIEEDNLKSEREKDYGPAEPRSEGPSGGTAPDSVPLEYLKNNFIRYYDAPSGTTQQPRYVQQYAVTESPEGPQTGPKPQYEQAPQQTYGYLSNVPMQIYLVPQYYNEPVQQSANTQHGVQYTAPPAPQVSSYPSAPENVQQHPNYNIATTYGVPAGNRLIQPYTTPVAYIGYAQPTLAPPQPSVTPVIAYQTPVVNFPTALTAPPLKNYQQNIQYESNTIADHGAGIHGQKYTPQPQISYNSQQEFPRYYNSRAPVGDDYRSNPIELPHPSPLLLKPSPPHLSHIPKALPIYRPLSKPIYASGNALISNTFTPKPSEAYGVPYKRRPNSLLDSYIPSSVQLEYLKRGYTRDPPSTYEALSSGRNFPPVFPVPRYYERGFLPNQMYQTAAGGVTFGHHKRAPKLFK